MLVHVEIVQMYLNKFNIIFQGMQGEAKTKYMPAGWCWSARSQTPRSVNQFLMLEHFSTNQHIGQSFS